MEFLTYLVIQRNEPFRLSSSESIEPTLTNNIFSRDSRNSLIHHKYQWWIESGNIKNLSLYVTILLFCAVGCWVMSWGPDTSRVAIMFRFYKNDKEFYATLRARAHTHTHTHTRTHTRARTHAHTHAHTMQWRYVVKESYLYHTSMNPLTHSWQIGVIQYILRKSTHSLIFNIYIDECGIRWVNYTTCHSGNALQHLQSRYIHYWVAEGVIYFFAWRHPGFIIGCNLMSYYRPGRKYTWYLSVHVGVLSISWHQSQYMSTITHDTVT